MVRINLPRWTIQVDDVYYAGEPEGKVTYTNTRSKAKEIEGWSNLSYNAGRVLGNVAGSRGDFDTIVIRKATDQEEQDTIREELRNAT